jgi:hypothetical protein
MADLRGGLNRIVRFESAAGPEWTDGRRTVTPLANLVVVGSGLAGRKVAPTDPERGVFTLSWPSAVETTAGGKTRRTPIVDVTRWGQLAIILFALLVLNEVWIRSRSRKERS